MTDPDTVSADYTLRPSELAATLALLVEARQPTILWGAPGLRQERARAADRRRGRAPVCRRARAAARSGRSARHPLARRGRPQLAERSPGDAVETCTILTTAANGTVAPIHGRMPVILPPDAWGAWLAGGEVPLTPYPADAMTAWPVSTHVNRPANDDPRCIEPVSLL